MMPATQAATAKGPRAWSATVRNGIDERPIEDTS